MSELPLFFLPGHDVKENIILKCKSRASFLFSQIMSAHCAIIATMCTFDFLQFGCSYWQSAAEKRGDSPFKDPLAIIGIIAILFPFIFVLIAIAFGVIDIKGGR
jgi:hypothetical protein